MKLLFICSNSIVNNRISLPQKDVHHIKTVLRKKVGEPLFLSDGKIIYRGTIESIAEKEIIVSSLTAEKEVSQTTPVTVVHSLIKAPNLELSLSKAVETGVSTYQPIITERCNMLSRDLVTRKRDRLLKKINEAAKQCGRANLMKLEEVLKFDSFLEKCKEQEGLKLFFDGTAMKSLPDMTEHIEQATSIMLLIGPEGGFSNDEKKKIVNGGFLTVTCGDFLWRSETAVIITTGFVQTILNSKRPSTQE